MNRIGIGIGISISLGIGAAIASCQGGSEVGGPVEKRHGAVQHEARTLPSPDGKRAVETTLITSGERRTGSEGFLGCGGSRAGDTYRVEVLLSVPGRTLRLKGTPIAKGILLTRREGFPSREEAWGVTSSLALESCWSRSGRRAAVRAAIFQPVSQRDFAVVEFGEGEQMRWGTVRAPRCEEAVESPDPPEWHTSP